MCAFCAAVPAALAVGAAVQGEQREARSRGEPSRWARWPVGRLTGHVVAALALTAAWYHARFQS